jgi:hypothetical protein
MKTIIQSIYVCLIIAISFGISQANDLKDGFMGTSWQVDLSDLNDFLKINGKDDLSYYVNPTVVYVIKDIRIPQPIYAAYKNKFFAVYIKIETFDVYNNLKQYITEKYGNSKMKIMINPDRTIYSWQQGDVKIKLKQNDENGDMKLGFYYTPLSTKVNAAQEAAFQKETKRFLDVDKERAVETLDLMKF